MNLTTETGEGPRELPKLQELLDSRAEREAFLHLAVDRFGAEAMGLSEGNYPAPSEGGERSETALAAISQYTDFPDGTVRHLCQWAIGQNGLEDRLGITGDGLNGWQRSARAFHASRHGEGQVPDSGWASFEDDYRALHLAMRGFEDQDRGSDRSCYELLAAVLHYLDPFYVGWVAANDLLGHAIEQVRGLEDREERDKALRNLRKQLEAHAEGLPA